MKKTIFASVMATTFCKVLFVLSAIGATNSDGSVIYPWDFLPDNNSVGTWIKSDTTNYKIWQDTDHPNSYLSDFINGGNGRYTPFGFVRGTMMVYQNSASEYMTVSIYESPNADSAMALYTNLGIGSATTPIVDLGDAARLDESALDISSISAVNNRYYIEMYAPKTAITETQSLGNLIFTKVDTYLASSGADYAFPASAAISASRVLSATTIKSGETISVTFTLTNAASLALNGFFFSENLPAGCTVATTSVKVNGNAITVTPSISATGAIYSGLKTHTWLIQDPSAYGGANTINASSGTIEIKYTIGTLGTGSVSLEGYAWAGKLGPEEGASSNSVFGYCDPVDITVTFDGWSDDFSDGNYTGWTVGEGSWSVNSGALNNSGTGRTSIYAGDASWTDISYTATVTPDSGTDVWVIFRVQDASNYYLYTLQSGKLYALVNGTYKEIGSGTAGFNSQTAYTISVLLSGNAIKISSNRSQVLSFSDNTYSNGKIGFGSNGAKGIFDNVQVTSTASSILTTYKQQMGPKSSIAVMPNPATSFTPIRVEYTGNEPISGISVHTLSGQLVAQPELSKTPYGPCVLIWGNNDRPGTALNAGRYIVRFTIGQHTVSKNLLIIRGGK